MACCQNRGMHRLDQDQHQDWTFKTKTKTETSSFESRDVSRPRLSSLENNITEIQIFILHSYSLKAEYLDTTMKKTTNNRPMHNKSMIQNTV